MKECFKCKEEKPLSEFYRHAAMGDGHLGKCKECTKNDARETRLKNIEYYREYDRKRGNRLPAGYQKEYFERYPNKYRAKGKVSRAIRNGDLVRKCCEVCGDKTTHAHHDDYSKALEVRWLCPAHHRQWHIKNGEGLNG